LQTKRKSQALIEAVLAEIVKDPAKYDGETIPVVGERISQPEIAKILSDVTGKTIK
jgi:taspase (threonine aspartase 1)